MRPSLILLALALASCAPSTPPAVLPDHSCSPCAAPIANQSNVTPPAGPAVIVVPVMPSRITVSPAPAPYYSTRDPALRQGFRNLQP